MGCRRAHLLQAIRVHISINSPSGRAETVRDLLPRFPAGSIRDSGKQSRENPAQEIK